MKNICKSFSSNIIQLETKKSNIDPKYQEKIVRGVVVAVERYFKK